MFIVTARIPKKRLLISVSTILCCAVVIAAALIITAGGGAVTASAEVSRIRDNDDRVDYLNDLGWQVEDEPVSTEELMIPETFDESYTEYLTLQSEQGFDLTRHCGKRITRYTYRVTNYSDSDEQVQAVLLLYRDRIIGGQLQAADGSFTLPLASQE